ncbi:V-type ATP synthase subunit E [Chlamydiales bacterium SCGC AG-110-M15]|nr:V-type ATP synthase subunit E [Chlamydiales bacterium SCGC AG-110-M15]
MTLEKGKDKIQHICAVLKDETLKPAQEEAKRIISEAKAERERIIEEAEANADKLVTAARESISRERSIFQSSLHQACRQGLESLRQDIENKLFNQELAEMLETGGSSAETVSKLINAIVGAIDKEGVGADISAQIPSTLSLSSVNSLLAENISKKLRQNTVDVGSFKGGARVKIHDKRVSIDITDDAMKELLKSYLSKDFRKYLFTENA